jgi:hypothetical protein
MNMDTIGGIAVDVSFKVNAAQIATWPPQVVAAFFDGVAKMLTAAEYGRQAVASGENLLHD